MGRSRIVVVGVVVVGVMFEGEGEGEGDGGRIGWVAEAYEGGGQVCLFVPDSHSHHRSIDQSISKIIDIN